MKTPDALNMLAMMADAEARSTATLIEMIAAAVTVKLQDPEITPGGSVEIALSQADLDAAMSGYRYTAAYDEHGTMTLTVHRAEEIPPK